VLRARFVARLVGAALFLYRATLKIERFHFDRCLGLKARGVPILYTLWHGRMFLTLLAHRQEGIVTMASRSKDGEIIAQWLEQNGFAVVRGSTTRGGGQALREMVRHVRGGRPAALTVDGPKGPARVVQPGIVQLARLTGGWILPITSSSSKPRFLASWDRYLMPLPFSKNVVAYGEPFTIGSDLSDEEAARQIARALDATTQEADEKWGQR
jgi:lysophospholipid acyltransferase (LPLAT)-like uncharacterized protein